MTHTISVTDKAGSRFGRYVTCERGEDLLSHVSRVVAASRRRHARHKCIFPKPYMCTWEYACLQPVIQNGMFPTCVTRFHSDRSTTTFIKY